MSHPLASSPNGPGRRLRSLLDGVTGLPTFDSLKVRDYRLLWLGQAGSSMGQWMDQVSRGWLMYQLTGSALQLGAATAVRGLPLLAFGLVAGAVADRSGRKQQLIIAQTANALLSLVLATLVLTRVVQPWHVYVTGFLTGTVQAFQQPARQTLVNDLVGGSRLMNALALNSAVVNGSRMVGPALAGVLIAASGVAGTYYAQALLFLFATIWTLQMQVPTRRVSDRSQPREPFLASIGGGIGYVAKDANIRALVLLALAPLTLAMPYTSLMPIFAKDILHGGPKLQGLLLASVGVGAFLGAVVVASVRRQTGYAWTVLFGAAAFSVALLGFAFSHWVVVSLAMSGIIGVFSVTYRTQNQTLLQVLAPSHARGRVMSIYLMDRGLVPIGTMVLASLAHAFGGPTAVAVMSLASLAVIALVIASHPGFARLQVPLHSAPD